MMKTTVVNKKHDVPYDVYIGRGSKWGNPFVVGTHGTRDEVVMKYRNWIYEQPDLIASLHELKGKVLCCYCHPLSCHGDVLAELANAMVKPTYRVIVAGSRGFEDDHLMRLWLNTILHEKAKTHKIQIISGTARGADKLGEEYAYHAGHEIKCMPADWNTHGKSAGYKRNAEMAECADACVVFWKDQSKGSKHMIDLAKKKGLALRVIPC